MLVGKPPTKGARLLRSARAQRRPETATEFSVDRGPVTADALGLLRRAEAGYLVALYR